MPSSRNVNTRAYWNRRFRSDWEPSGGRGQSRFFAETALANLPKWFEAIASRARPTICDWGCAEGDGTAVLASRFGKGRVRGIDFSDIAIQKARKYYPQLSFEAQDWLKQEPPPRAPYDIVYSSNTLEHFASPNKILALISVYARHAVILLVPFKELERLDEHYHTFVPENIPLAPTAEFALVHARVINTGAAGSTHWSGEQILLIYGRVGWLAQTAIPLGTLGIDEGLGEAYEEEKAARRELVAALTSSHEQAAREMATKDREIDLWKRQAERGHDIIRAREAGLAWLRAERESARQDLETKQAELDLAKENIETLRQKLVLEQEQRSQTQNQLESMRAELDSGQGDLRSAKGEVTTVRGELTAAQAELTSVRGELDATKRELAAAQGQVEGERAALAYSRGEAAAVQTQMEAVKGALRLSAAELNEIRGSKAWKLVSMYRKIRELVAAVTFPIRRPLRWYLREDIHRLRAQGISLEPSPPVEAEPTGTSLPSSRSADAGAKAGKQTDTWGSESEAGSESRPTAG